MYYSGTLVMCVECRTQYVTNWVSFIGDIDREVLRPMTCPFHFIYNTIAAILLLISFITLVLISHFFICEATNGAANLLASLIFKMVYWAFFGS